MEFNQNVFNRLVAFLRFPLAVAVVAIHCTIVDCHPLFRWTLQNLIFLAVPLFFIISGYYFTHSAKTYKTKIADRIKTILIPYFLWNTIAWIVSMRKTGFVWPTWNSFILNPIDFPLWFLRDLFILCLFHPVIVQLGKIAHGTLLFAICLVVAYLQFTCSYPYMGSKNLSLLYFCTGVFLHGYAHKFFALVPFHRNVVYVLTIILFVCFLWLRSHGFQIINTPQYHIYIMMGCISVLMLGYQFIKNSDGNRIVGFIIKLEKYSFFIFAVHIILISGFFIRIITLLPIYPELQQILVILSITICCIFLFILLRKYMPRVLFWLTGSRV